MRAIPLTKGKYALVSDEDYERVSQFKWTALHSSDGHIWYAYRQPTVNGKRKNVYLHRFVLNEPDGHLVDHINGDGLDCRRENLRLATEQQNRWNRSRRIQWKSRYVGVVRDHNRFQARAHAHGERMYFGSYPSEVMAAEVYDAVVRRLRGEFARTNFPYSNPQADKIAKTLLEEKGIAT